jgi:hypothetical protein
MSNGNGHDHGHAGDAHADLYDTDEKMMVLSADRIGGLVAPQVLINHVTQTKIYGDGRVVFINPAVGSGEIHEGKLDRKQIEKLFKLLKQKGFWSFQESYFVSGPTDMPTSVITAKLHAQPEKRVGCYGGALSAPPGFMDCFEALSYPQLQPTNVHTYVRAPISQAELDAGWYWGFEYQKKLDTPRDWIWTEAGRSSKWHKPAPAKPDVMLDSGYMIPVVDGCHRIRIGYKGNPTAAGATIQFDRNAMSPDAYGNIGVTTLVYYFPKAATFAPVQEEGDQHLFSIAVDGYSGPKLRLVVFGSLDDPQAGRLLVLDDSDHIQSIYHLQRR